MDLSHPVCHKLLILPRPLQQSHPSSAVARRPTVQVTGLSVACDCPMFKMRRQMHNAYMAIHCAENAAI